MIHLDISLTNTIINYELCNYVCVMSSFDSSQPTHLEESNKFYFKNMTRNSKLPTDSTVRIINI